LLVVEVVLEVERRVGGDLVPIGERVAQLRGPAAKIEGGLGTLAHVLRVHVQVELGATAEPERELLAQPRDPVLVLPFRDTYLEPLLELGLARQHLHVHAGRRKAPPRRPHGLLVRADRRIFLVLRGGDQYLRRRGRRLLLLLPLLSDECMRNDEEDSRREQRR